MHTTTTSGGRRRLQDRQEKGRGCDGSTPATERFVSTKYLVDAGRRAKVTQPNGNLQNPTEPAAEGERRAGVRPNRAQKDGGGLLQVNDQIPVFGADREAPGDLGLDAVEGAEARQGQRVAV